MDLIKQNLPLLLLLISSMGFVGCSISPNLTSYLESDELYLSSDEEFITDAEYLAHASESNDDDYYSSEYYGDSYGSSYGGYNSGYNSSYNSYYPSSCGNGYYGGLGLGSYFSPFGGSNNYGYNPYGYSNYGYNNYGYDPYGYGGYYGNYYGSGYGGDTYTSSTILIGSRTPIISHTLSNSNYHGGRLLTNKVESTNNGNITEPIRPAETGANRENSSPGWDNNRPAHRQNNNSFNTPTTRPSNNNSINNRAPSSRPSSRPASRNSGSRSSGSRPSGSRK